MADLDVHLAGIVTRDEAAFRAWLAGAEPALRRALRRFAASVDVESVLQETLLRIWQAAPRHTADGRPDSLLRVAHRIAHNLAVDEARRLGRERTGVDVHDAAHEALRDERPAPDPLLARALLACLQALPAQPARVLRERLHARGRSDDDLAARLHMAVNTFRQNVARARRALTRCLHGRGIDAHGEPR